MPLGVEPRHRRRILNLPYPEPMAQATSTAGYTADDLDWLRADLGVAHLELDPWGSLLVTPATDRHETAIAILHAQALRQLPLPPGCVRSNSPAWKIPGGSGYTNVPDLSILAPGWRRVGELHLDPAPLLVVEVASPSTRGVDQGRKLSDYRLGGAGIYLRVELSDVATGRELGFEVHDFAGDRFTTSPGSVDLLLGDTPVRFDLSALDDTSL